MNDVKNNVFTYEFILKGINAQNLIVDFEEWSKNNTDTVLFKSDEHSWNDGVVEKTSWEGGSCLSGDYDLPLYKFENDVLD